METTMSFEQMPAKLMEIDNKLNRLLALRNQPNEETDKLFTLDELIDYLPEHPARQTCYGWVNDRLIPFEKHGKRLYFRKSSISKWLDNGRRIK